MIKRTLDQIIAELSALEGTDQDCTALLQEAIDLVGGIPKPIKGLAVPSPTLRRTSDKPTVAGNYLVLCGNAYQVVSVVDECGTLFAHHANGCRQVDRYSKFCEWLGPYYTEDAMTEAIRRAEGEGARVS